MGVFEKICTEMLEKCREYVDEGNYIELIKYLNKKEVQIEKLKSTSKSEEKYVDNLVDMLK